MMTPDKTGPVVALVVAAAENGVIGADGALPWRISDDLKWFRKATLGKPVIMGRKTFQSIGRALPGRDNIVLTRRDDFSAEGAMVARDLDEALAIAAGRARADHGSEVCVIGGAEIYAQCLPRADRIYFTRVKAEIAGDAAFPDLAARDWRVIRVAETGAGPGNDFPCAFFVLDRRPARA